jgi:hypothetical protein
VQLRETIRIETSHIDQASIAKADNYSLGKISWMRPFSNTDEYDLKEGNWSSVKTKMILC